MNFAVGIACLLVVAVLGEVAGTSNEQLLVKDHSKIQDRSSMFLKQEQEQDLKDLELHTKSLKKKKTKLHCKILGGQCEHKKHDCHGGYGWCFKGSDYCKFDAHYCCCVPPPPKGCVFGDVSYPHKAFLTESCFHGMHCLNGEWHVHYDTIHKDCESTHCSAFPVSMIQPFEGSVYEFKPIGTWTLTAKDSLGLDYYGVEVSFDKCKFPNGNYSCVKSFLYYEHDLAVEIIPAIPGPDQVIVNDLSVEMENGTSRTFTALGGSVLVFKESPLSFLLISSNGISVRITREPSNVLGVDPTTTVDVWMIPPKQPGPQGLCAGGPESKRHLFANRSLRKSNELVKKIARLE